ncbi:MAG: ATP-dependent DNA helicase RecG [Candidatus Peribacteraceae bacterium]|nr:ATP-dependent DNA helicase RecG [Candidatus Peribacteraceae bacterium]MDD5739829.1 ATP-dependent DNA helicase RecG [Candidatus Peribacteraceae bacterium]
MKLSDSLTVALLRTTPAFIDALKAMSIETVEQLAGYLPRAHEDLSQIQTIGDAPLGEKVTVRGTVSRIELVRTRKRKMLVKALFMDLNGDSAEVVWFNQPHVKRMLTDGDEVVLTGKIEEEGYKLKMMSPQFERAGTRPLVHAGRLVPIYPQHDIISTKWLREKMVFLRSVMRNLPETLPKEVLEEEHLLSRAMAIEALHFPGKPEDVARARERLAFEEMYRIQLEALTQRQEWQRFRQERLKIPMDPEIIKAFFQTLKFTPTKSQKIAIYEILRDMEKDTAMSRLLEGDVGSGKTLVAAAVMANVLAHGGQCALMVPTEVLARQHAETIARMLVALHNDLAARRAKGERVPVFRMPTVSLLVGSLRAADAAAMRRSVAEGKTDIVIGTHALIQEAVTFADLKFVIVDEQHRFGVDQRVRLQEKGSPHVLTMTATPIPRTLALTAYGHHDLSVLLEKPGNRKKIHTKVVSPRDRVTVERFIDQQIGEGRQVFVICPLITASDHEEMAEVKSVENEERRLKESFPRRRIAVLHGRMQPREKQRIMRLFKERQVDLLVSTAVIEVGIDVPNASIMLIEGAERFGLAQLHQFRGRVGRGEHQSNCFLATTTVEQARSPRLKAMEEHDSGFILAEIDLKLRGFGELFGTRQSGFSFGAFQEFVQPEFIVRARRAAERTLGEKPFAGSGLAARL